MNKDIPINLYKQIHAVMPILCVDVVILYEGKALLCKRTNEPVKGQYWVVGGRVFKGETLKEAVIRKVQQEAGIEVKIIEQLGVEETMFDTSPFGGDTHTVNAVYLAVPKGKSEPKLDSQHEEFKWFSTIKKDFHPYIKKYIRLAKKVYEKKL